MGDVFVTGGSGLLGSRLVRVLRGRGDRVIALRRERAIGNDAPAAGAGGLEIVRGDLLDPKTYAEALGGVSTVVHLAAATGRASAQQHFRVNQAGTELLLEQCRRSGVEKFVFVSTIAVKFPDKRRYFYAQAKQGAEEAVERCDMQWMIVRPTIIVAPGAPVLAGLRRLAGLPLVTVFGNGRARVQPIWVDDLVDLLIEIMDAEARRQTIEIGGPDQLSIEELLQEVRRVCTGRTGRCVHLPMAPILALLGLVESTGFRALPVTAGQLASFRFDGTAGASELFESRRSSLTGITEMLETSLSE